LKNHEKQSFLNIFLGYFISVTIFIILLGYLYLNQQQLYILQKTAMNMHQYLLKLKQSGFKYTQKGYSYNLTKNSKVKRALPYKENGVYIKAFSKFVVVKVDAIIVDKELKEIRTFVIILQIILILFFIIISWILTKRSLKPMADTISHLDRFLKDLIHDLNTPVTAILLNTTMLKKVLTNKELKKINRIEQSAKNISSLYENLELILNNSSLIKSEFDIANTISQTIDTFEIIYPNIEFIYNKKSNIILSNQNAIKRIVDNIISNSCKYCQNDNPKVTIVTTKDTITIEDNGKGIKYPQKIFERSYKENQIGHGIGMHIVHRLCSELNIKIKIKSIQNIGTSVELYIV